jgi:hypothetical protein
MATRIAFLRCSASAEFETVIRREQQMEGIAEAKLVGVYRGRKPAINARQVQSMAAEGVGDTEIAGSAARPSIGCWRPLWVHADVLTSASGLLLKPENTNKEYSLAF